MLARSSLTRRLHPQAFANLPADFLAYLLANPATALTQVLTYHVLPINLPGA